MKVVRSVKPISRAFLRNAAGLLDIAPAVHPPEQLRIGVLEGQIQVAADVGPRGHGLQQGIIHLVGIAVEHAQPFHAGISAARTISSGSRLRPCVSMPKREVSCATSTCSFTPCSAKARISSSTLCMSRERNPPRMSGMAQ